MISGTSRNKPRSGKISIHTKLQVTSMFYGYET